MRSMKNKEEKLPILIIDDDEDLIILMAYDAKKDGVVVDSALTTKEGLKKLSEKKYFMVFLGIFMGSDATSGPIFSFLKSEENEYNFDTPMIVMSAKMEPDLEARIKKRNPRVVFCLEKPLKRKIIAITHLEVTKVLRALWNVGLEGFEFATKSNLVRDVVVESTRNVNLGSIQELNTGEVQETMKGIEKKDNVLEMDIKEAYKGINHITEKDLNNSFKANYAKNMPKWQKEYFKIGLDLMLSKKDEQVLKKTLENPQYSNQTGANGLMIYALKGEKKHLKAVLETKIAINKQDKNGKAAINYAVLGGNFENLRFLVENQAWVTVKDKDDREVLFDAIFLDRVDFVEFLIKSGAKVNYAIRGETYLSQTLDANNLKMFEVLLKNGAKTTMRNTQGKTIKDIAEAKKAEPFIKLIEKYNN